MVVPAVAKLSCEDSHLRIVPTCPDKVKVVLFVPVQTVVAPATVPPTEAGVTVTVVELELAEEQLPF